MSAAAIVKSWAFMSSSDPTKLYQTLKYRDGSTSCDCPGWRYKKKAAGGMRTCKHTRLVDMGLADTQAVKAKDYTKAGRAAEAAQLEKVDLLSPVGAGRAFNLTEE